MGVVIETIWCYIKYRKIESRKGVIFGPFNPLYGLVAAALCFCVNSLSKQNAGRIFLVGVVVSSAIEYLCSYYQEKYTGAVSWNYKKFKFNLNGRINLAYSLMWGVLTVLWFETFVPMVEELLPFFIEHNYITISASILMALDCFISLAASIRRNQRRNKIYPKTKFEKHLDYIYTDDLMEKVYPNSDFVDDDTR